MVPGVLCPWFERLFEKTPKIPSGERLWDTGSTSSVLTDARLGSDKVTRHQGFFETAAGRVT